MAQRQPLFHSNRLNYDRIFLDSEVQYVPVKPSQLVGLHEGSGKNRVGYAILDSYHAGYYGTRFKRVLPKGYLVCLTNPLNIPAMTCSHDLRCKRVAVLDLTSYQFVKTLQKAYRIKDSEFELYELNQSYVTSLGAPGVNRSFDMIYAYVIPGSRFFLSLQNQNLAMIGFDLSKLDENRMRLFWPNLRFETSVYLPRLFGNRLTYPEKYVALPAIQESVVLWGSLSARLAQPLFQRDNRLIETFISRLERPEEDNDDQGHLFRCHGDPFAVSKVECESLYDSAGRKRDSERLPIWDSPCRENTDCPFYNPERGRGQCLPSGYCEMPIGVQPIGFRRANTEPPYTPFCDGCDPMDAACCPKKQRDYVASNGKLPAPQWAFPGDALVV